MRTAFKPDLIQISDMPIMAEFPYRRTRNTLQQLVCGMKGIYCTCRKNERLIEQQNQKHLRAYDGEGGSVRGK